MRLTSVGLAVLLALGSSAFALSTHAQNRADDRAAGLQLAFSRAQRLRHGINASLWFAQVRDYSAARTNSYIDDQDIALIAKMGFDYVRLPIDAVPLEQSMRGRGGPRNDFMTRLDHAVDTMLANGLAVIVDVHPEDDFKQQLQTGYPGNGAVDRFAMLWRWLAAHYAGRDPDRVFFEILNEPEVYDRYRWAGIQQRLSMAIRQSAPRHTIVAAGANYSDIQDLLALEPLADGNVIYNFHFYDPHQFTHQGADWGLSWWVYTHGIPYPATDASMQAILPQVPDAADRFTLESYWLDHWDARRIRLLIDEAAAWARENNVPLICNEFGVFGDHSDPESRANWIRDVRTALEADGIGWAMWDYRSGFGVVNKKDGEAAVPDEAVLKALGMKK